MKQGSAEMAGNKWCTAKQFLGYEIPADGSVFVSCSVDMGSRRTHGRRRKTTGPARLMDVTGLDRALGQIKLSVDQRDMRLP